MYNIIYAIYYYYTIVIKYEESNRKIHPIRYNLIIVWLTKKLNSTPSRDFNIIGHYSEFLNKNTLIFYTILK